MLKQLLPAHSLAFVDHQALFYEVFGVLAEFGVVREGQGLGQDVGEVGGLGAAGPWGVTEDHLEEHDAEGPDVAFSGVGLGF